MIMRIFYKEGGFTLAEVLIVLGIIGIVATMTIPTVINNYKKHQVVSQLKKVYSELSQAVSMAKVDHGELRDWKFATLSLDGSEDTDFANTYLIPYLRVAKNCKNTEISCTNINRYYLNGTAYNINAQPNSINNTRFILSDGTLLWLNITTSGANIFVDINGNLKPNVFGKDAFGFKLMPKQNNIMFFAQGYDKNILIEDVSGCSASATGPAGLFCGALILHDGWQIKNDYPWD